MDANLAQEADCYALRLCCPVCRELIVVGTDAATPSFRHAAASSAAQARGASRSRPGSAKRIAINTTYAHANRGWNSSDENASKVRWEGPGTIQRREPRVGGDIEAAEPGRRAFADLSLALGVYCAPPSRKRLKDSVEFFAAAEKYLRSAKASCLDVPESGLRRHVRLNPGFTDTTSSPVRGMGAVRHCAANCGLNMH